MKAIVPLNVAAIRISDSDQNKVKSRIARFEALSSKKKIYTGDQISSWDDLGNGHLKPGIHIHWELPDYFKNGIQKAGKTEVSFPHAPNRWLVIRTLCQYKNNQWSLPGHRCWLIESDHISPNNTDRDTEMGKTIVPISLDAKKSYSYMGRVVKPDDKDEVESLYLKDFKNPDGTPMYLTATGFLGPQFSSYYPDCCSVFGFYDNFADNAKIAEAIKENQEITFKVGYQVIGWEDGNEDPMDLAMDYAQNEYNEYRKMCEETDMEIKRSLFDFWLDYTKQNIGWTIHSDALNSQNLPDKTICNGIIQEIVWKKTNSFIEEFEYKGQTKIAVGNTRSEAVSALLSDDKDKLNTGDQKKYENLLNLLQAGKLDNLESRRNILTELPSDMHHNNFAREHSGLRWTISLDEIQENPDRQNYPVLPANLVNQLDKLNQAQKNYDNGYQSLAALRKQLFMDWFTYVKYKSARPGTSSYIEIKKFNEQQLMPSIRVLLDEERQKLKDIGELKYEMKNEVVVSLRNTDDNPGSLASIVSLEFDRLIKLMDQESTEMKLMVIPSTPFYYPTEPVTAIETDCLQYINRNNVESALVRTNDELISKVTVQSGNFSAEVSAADFEDIKLILPEQIRSEDLISIIKQLFVESVLLMPSNAQIVANALRKKGGPNNPACSNFEKFQITLRKLQGGQSKLDVDTSATGLFELISTNKPEFNPEVHTDEPINLSLTFTNETKQALPPDSAAWKNQQYNKVCNTYEPFIPLFLKWEVSSQPILRNTYKNDSIKDYFELDADGNNYVLKKKNPEYNDKITYKALSIIFKNNLQETCKRMQAVMGKTNSGLLRNQLNSIEARKIVAIDLNGLKENQLMRTPLPAWELIDNTDDEITKELVARINDDWRSKGFNTESPTRDGFKNYSDSKEFKFHPIRDGYMDINSIEFIDVFGQSILAKRQNIKVIPAQTLTDGNDNTKVFFAPRLLSPAHISTDWCHDEEFASPIWGWIVPDNLNNNLFFYKENGNPLGSLGIEHGKVVYRPSPGREKTNALTITDTEMLVNDIGERGKPIINRKLAAFMWYVYSSKNIFQDLYLAIDNSSKYIDGNNNLKDGSLSVLIGRPVALATISLQMATAGSVLPTNQAFSAWEKDILKRRNFTQRVEQNSANLASVEFFLRLGDRADTNDGLIAYQIEENSQSIYSEGRLELIYSSKETHAEMMVKLNESYKLTVIFSPDSSIHFKSGILPVSSLNIEKEQYADLVDRLDVVFPAYQVLKQQNLFDLTMPEQDKYSWYWVNADSRPNMELKESSPATINYGYSPQTIEEGWLKLQHDK